MTGQKSVPNVFINKTHVGGCDKTMQVSVTSTDYDEEMLFLVAERNQMDVGDQ